CLAAETRSAVQHRPPAGSDPGRPFPPERTFGMDSALSRRRPAPRAPRTGLRLEHLEARETPAVFTVTSAADAGPGSLRQAILDANTTPALDTIRFQIGTGVQVIHPATALPDVTAPVVLDATTQPGFAGAPIIIL